LRGKKCGGDKGLSQHLGIAHDRLDDDSRLPWRKREFRHEPADVGKTAIGFEGFEKVQRFYAGD